jgi:hypothetical protein
MIRLAASRALAGWNMIEFQGFMVAITPRLQISSACAIRILEIEMDIRSFFI